MELYLSLALAALVMLVLTLLERVHGKAKTDWFINLQSWAISLGTGFLMLPLFGNWQGVSLLDGAQLPFWLGVVLFLFVRDLGEYLFHRAQHRIPWLWAMHSLHHSDPEMSALTTNRHFWGDQLLKSVTIWTAASMVVAPTAAILAAYNLFSLWNYLVHARLPIDFGRWSWVINTPAYHRRHHSLLPEHYDSNFAGLFPRQTSGICWCGRCDLPGVSKHPAQFL